jgi:hypothetical protein
MPWLVESDCWWASRKNSLGRAIAGSRGKPNNWIGFAAIRSIKRGEGSWEEKICKAYIDDSSSPA